MADATILLISDDSSLAGQVREITDAIRGLDLEVVGGVDAAYNYKHWDGISLALIHQSERGSAMQVARLLRMIAAARRPVATIVLGDPYDDDQAIALLRMGVADYLGLPLDRARLTCLFEILTARHRKSALPAAVAVEAGQAAPAPERPTAPALAPAAALEVADVELLDGATPEVAALVDQVRRVASQGATILLGGETGTGKTRLARRIHEISDRRDEPFLVVNCGTLSASLIEAELFGHVRGAFEGATADRPGKFAEVGRGTLFLDGVDALPLPVQTKLLRVVEDRAFEPIGGSEAIPLRARLIAASNRPLDEEVAERRFRSDLYYRLNVVGFRLPPLRERRDAIAKLAERFLEEFAAAEGRVFEPLGEDAMQALQEHDWPGNIRELRNVLARCVAVCPDRTIRREDLPISVLDGAARLAAPVGVHPIVAAHYSRSSLAQTKGQAELARITEALEKHNNNRLRAAAELGISRMTLYKKLYKYGLMNPPTPVHHPVG